MAKIEYVVEGKPNGLEYKGKSEEVPFVCAVCMVCTQSVISLK